MIGDQPVAIFVIRQEAVFWPSPAGVVEESVVRYIKKGCRCLKVDQLDCVTGIEVENNWVVTIRWPIRIVITYATISCVSYFSPRLAVRSISITIRVAIPYWLVWCIGRLCACISGSCWVSTVFR